MQTMKKDVPSDMGCRPSVFIDFASVSDTTACAALLGFFASVKQSEDGGIEILPVKGCVERPLQTRWILVTDNPCPEFLEDWWDRGASALVRTCELADFSRVLATLHAGQRFRLVAAYDGLLTRCERQVLELEVYGYTVDEIALQLGKSARTARDQAMNARDKLRARHPRWRLRRTQHLVHYYFGRWSLLEPGSSGSAITGVAETD